jgi:VCBS repeat-containing protein
MLISRSIRVILFLLTVLLLLWHCQADMPPVARDDTAATDRNVPVTISVLANDTASTGRLVASTVTVVGGPGHGTALAQADGTVTYTPATDFVGMDSFSYVVTDTAGETSNTATVTVTVRVVNSAPVANAGPESNTMTGRPVVLDGAQSFDPDHDPLTYTWQVVAVPPTSTVTTASLVNAQTAAPSFTPDVDGIYVLEVTVSDGTLSSTAQVQVTVGGPPNVPPNANAGQPQTAQVGTVVRLDGMGSQDPDNGPQPLMFQWSLLAVPSGSALTTDEVQDATTPLATFTPDVVGVYLVGLEVSDGLDTSQAEVQITATPPNVAPNANAGPHMVVQLGNAVNLNGTASHDPDNGPQPLTFQWTFVSKPSTSGLTNASIQDATTATPHFTPDVAGIYVLRLDVSDGEASSFAQVLVKANVAPVAVDDTFHVDQDQTLTVPAPGVLSNDTDGNNDPLTVVLGDTVSHGALTLNADGSFTYTPTTGFSGTDSFTYQANDGRADSNMAAVTVTVTKPNINQAPVVNTATFSVAENSANGTVVGTVTFTDPDAGQSHIFAISSGNTNNAFAVAGTGQLTVATSTALDFETTPSFNLTVRVTDNGTPAKSGSAIITVNLTNVNEAPVVNTATFSVPENSANGTVVGTVTFTDPDMGQSGIFAISAGNTSGAFAINASTGQLTVATSAALNIGTTPSFNLTIRVTDNGAPPLSGSATITVNLTNVNKAPVVTVATFSAAENSANGTVVGTVTFTDPDAGQSHTFAIAGGNTGGAFALNSTTGQLTVATSAALDFETTPNFGLTVQVTDNGTPPLSGSATITVSLTNVNEAPVVNTAMFTVPENSANGTVVGTVTFTDPDAGQSHTFAIAGGNTGGAFALNPTTGQLTVATSAALDFETTPSFSLTIQVTDNGTPPLSGSATITVSLTNVNEALVVNAATFTLPENSATGTTVGTVTFSDPDAGQSHTFAIVGGNTNNAFAISPSTGQLMVATSAALNFETTPSFSLTVQVTDNGAPPLSGSATITVNLTNVNEAPVVNAATFTLPENSVAGTTAGTVTFSDPDAGTIGTFAITGGNTNNAFAINPTTGVITVAAMAAVDFETTPTFTLTVQVTDNGAPPLLGSATITVNLIDVNDPPVAIAKTYSAQANMQIAIPAASGLLIGATDQDDALVALSVATVSATIPSGGTVTLGAGGAFDFDPPPGVIGDVTFTYTVCDDGTPTPACSAPVTVTFNVAGPVIWFVDDSAAPGGDGRLSHPFQTLASAAAVDVENDNIFLFSGTYTTGLTLLTGEGLIGQGVSTASDSSFTSFDAVFGISPPVGTVARPSINGTRPTVQATVTLATNSEVRGLNISTTSTTGLSGDTVSGVTVSEVSVTTASTTAVHLTDTGGTILKNSITMLNVVDNHTILISFSGTGSSSALLISGNTVTHNGLQDGIHVDTPNAGTSPNFSVTVTNNNVTAPNGVNAISLNARQSSIACFNVLSNTTAAPNGNGVQVRQVTPGVVRLERGGSASNTASVVLAANNPAAGGSTPTSVAGTVSVVNNGTCATPP